MEPGDETADRPSGRILRVKAGYNPNSSSIGSVVFVLPALALAAPLVYSLIGAAAFSGLIKQHPAPPKESEDVEPS